MDIDEPRISLPGFGLPVPTLPQWSRNQAETSSSYRFPHGIADYFATEGVSVRETRMLTFVNQITDKPGWHRKVFDAEICTKWHDEAVKWDESLCEKGDYWLSETMFEHCLKELREKATLFQQTGLVNVLEIDATIVKSDSLVCDELKHRLREAVRPLETIPDQLKDWHPGSDEKVLDLVHPSLFPVIFGRTRVLPTGAVPLKTCVKYTGMGETTAPFEAAAYHRSGAWGNDVSVKLAWGSFQWLPSNVTFDANGKPHITSYINNLHPRLHAELYQILEGYVDAAMPLFSECLSWFHSRIRIDIAATSNEDWSYPEGVKFPRDQYRQVDENYDPTDSEQEEDEDMGDRSWAWEHNCHDEYNEWHERHRILEQPEPVWKSRKELIEEAGAKPIDLKKDFSGGIQIIFKLASIHLTPDKPTYDGGSWHIEGSLNEHICATALYYYDSDNVTDSYLGFRQSFDTEAMVMKPAQSEYSSLEAYYGVSQNGGSTCELPSILTREGRLLAFPNVLQHQVQPFRLADPAKPGHRKILAMFLVDPHVPILSTANVPPQRKDWWAGEVRRLGRFAELPEELFEMIIQRVDDFPLSWPDAVQVREELMAERGKQDEEMNQAMEQDTFSFCEH
ncbi:hypothetical protein EJ04DRAFT_484494 [Polyplosphaeria fusca]|uniref:Uncharacterized protein n=1 Tax=Polyplosphaeria fusca TaxID=682080 RepID=A0A9P4R585_9PLEO|nr:hypothetical protein EJ04DRAFT_484494 [Polyplosphaeria fusca]